MRREIRSVLGHHAINLWMLVAVLTATFLSVSFSSGSMDYLKEKMEDPFTFWVNVNLRNGEHIDEFKEALDKDSVRSHYGFVGRQTEVQSSINLVDCKDKYDIYSTLFYEDMRSDFVAAVLEEDNIINDVSVAPGNIVDESLGIIVTAEVLERLGYDLTNLPAYLDYHSHSPGAEELGITLLPGEYARIPLPLLAVVKRLPMNMDVIASKYLYQQIANNIDRPLSLNNESIIRDLRFFVPEGIKFEKDEIADGLPDSLRNYISNSLPSQESIQDRLRSWKQGRVYKVYTPDESLPLSTIHRIEECVLNHYAQQGVERVYAYETGYSNEGSEVNGGVSSDDIISIHFSRLDSISPFERFVKETTDLQIEMTQVNSKKNFDSVSRMADILTLALLMFAIVSIIIFVVNMMQSYFQKVKRNLGTFKAFGISTKELIWVYVAIIAGIVVAALAIALAVTLAVELTLSLFGIVQEGGSPYLALCNWKTLGAVAIIIVSTIASVLVVMHRLLKQTPGNLIYDR